MPKRLLTVQNKGNEHEEQSQSSSVITRLSSKRTNRNESIPSKKARIEEKHVDKENIPKRQITKPKEPSPPVNIIEPVVDKTVIVPNDSDNESEDDDDQEEEEESPVIISDNGQDYPSNKQYIIYENAGSNKEPFIISKTARFWNQKYRKAVDHVNPDTYGMYIHNDFSNYGELEVVENCLVDLTKALFIAQQGVLARLNYVRKPDNKVNYILGFRRLEALAILLDYTDGISGIDDGERFGNIIRVIGACYVTTLRGLLPQAMFKKLEKIDQNLVKQLKRLSKQIPNFKQVLERSLIVGHMFQTIGNVCSAYTNILQIVYCNWVFMIEQTKIDLNKTPNGRIWDALKHAAGIDEDDVDGDEETFDFLNELRLYKEQYSLGGDSHDLSKWSRAERAEYDLGRFDEFDGLWF